MLYKITSGYNLNGLAVSTAQCLQTRNLGMDYLFEIRDDVLLLHRRKTDGVERRSTPDEIDAAMAHELIRVLRKFLLRSQPVGQLEVRSPSHSQPSEPQEQLDLIE